MPLWVKNKMLKELFELTANSFGCDYPDLSAFSYKRNLMKYALFSKEAVDKALENGSNPEIIKDRLYKSSYAIGERIRKELEIELSVDIFAIIEIVYKTLDIDIHFSQRGDLKITRCFFSSIYNQETCRIISAIDQGIVAGISNGLILDFNQRITEGKNCCRASLSLIGNKI
jgi:hypothetical protein